RSRDSPSRERTWVFGPAVLRRGRSGAIASSYRTIRRVRPGTRHDVTGAQAPSSAKRGESTMKLGVLVSASAPRAGRRESGGESEGCARHSSPEGLRREALWL